MASAISEKIFTLRSADSEENSQIGPKVCRSECGSVSVRGIDVRRVKIKQKKNSKSASRAELIYIFLTITRVDHDDYDDDQVLIQLLPHSTSVNYYLVATASASHNSSPFCPQSVSE